MEEKGEERTSEHEDDFYGDFEEEGGEGLEEDPFLARERV